MPATAPLEPGVLDFLKVLGLLGGVILLAFLALRYWLPRLATPASRGPIRIAARLVLEPRRTLYIVHAGGRYLLLGVSEGGIRRLGMLDGEAVEGALAEAAAQRRPKLFRRQ